MFTWLRKILGKPECLHTWTVVNKEEVPVGIPPIYKCLKCGKYRK
ncbi:hypothetical protein P5F55_13780 [Clostridium perfringens]|nr:hypothetical protein [Clostridium perfringens]MDK0928431.1 hypothetical protein [Clostridium perfringens]MDM0495345.1 hypothetical protein [Clostridium perfringens]MDM0781061.1 hypothetical protein [Clostridium perfringens]